MIKISISLKAIGNIKYIYDFFLLHKRKEGSKEGEREGER